MSHQRISERIGKKISVKFGETVLDGLLQTIEDERLVILNTGRNEIVTVPIYLSLIWWTQNS